MTASPDRYGHLYYVGETPSVSVGPLASGVKHSTVVTDLGRGTMLSPMTLQQSGQYWNSQLPSLGPGIYAMNADDSSGNLIAAYTWGVVNPALPLSMSNIESSPFALWLCLTPTLNWEQEEEASYMIGVHNSRTSFDGGGTLVYPWCDGEISPGVYAWSSGTDTPMDTKCDRFLEWGLYSGAALGYTPSWAMSATCAESCGNELCPPEPQYLPNLTNYSSALAQRSAGLYEDYELYNEPNPGAGFWDGTTAQVVASALAAGSGLHSGDPNAKLYGPTSAGMAASLSYIPQCFQLGGPDVFDIIDLHPYCNEVPTTGRVLKARTCLAI